MALQSALEDKNFLHARLIVRFLADLVNASVLLPDCIIALFDALLAVLTETDVPQVRHVCICTYVCVSNHVYV